MPELPEVETTRRGIEPGLKGAVVRAVLIRQGQLRWPVPGDLGQRLNGQRIQAVHRRAKYLLLETRAGTLLIHLGMSGSLRLIPEDTPPQPHDHVDLRLSTGRILRLRDPRRFGAVLWAGRHPERHPLLAHLGPEPLAESCNGDYLYARATGRRLAVKALLMDSKVVVGIGNIYASEALFRAGIHPGRPAGRISRRRYEALAKAVKAVLGEAIEQGGTTLRDFAHSDGRPGYFQQQLQVYGRPGEACPGCQGTIHKRVIGQRSSFFCPRCQR